MKHHVEGVWFKKYFYWCFNCIYAPMMSQWVQ